MFEKLDAVLDRFRELDEEIAQPEVIQNFEKACGKKIPYVIAPRRAGDIPTCYSDPTKAEKELGWKAQFGIEKMCEDAWRWQSDNPNGYDQ